jgi:hypothetical protein
MTKPNKPINPFPINFNTNKRTPESQALLDKKHHKCTPKSVDDFEPATI